MLPVFAQEELEGAVINQHKIPVEGASIVVNSKQQVFSDRKGVFTFEIKDLAAINIEVKALGYEVLIVNYPIDSLPKPLVLQLSPSVEKISEIVVAESASEKLKKQESISIQLIQEEYFKESKASSLMGTLNSIPGVNSMDVGSGISKPMIRGMSYYRVIIAQNGIKTEGQQWSNHHGVSIDQQTVNHVELIKGPAALQYGSGAIGGVINILPDHVPLNSGVSGEASIVGKSNTKWKGGSANVVFRNIDLYGSLSFTYNEYNDFYIPETDSFLLPAPVSAAEASHKVLLGNQMYNTAGNENAISASLGIVKDWGNSYLKASYYSTETGFFDWQGIQSDSLRSTHQVSKSDILFPKQKVNNYSVHYFTNRYFNENKLEVALGYQLNNTGEYNYLDDRTGNRLEELKYYKEKGNLELDLKLHTLTGNVFYSVKNSSVHQFKIGFNSQYQHQIVDGFQHILPEYEKLSLGTFLTYRYNISKKWVLNNGVRIDFTNLKLTETVNPDPEYGDSIFNPEFSNLYPGFAFSSGVNYKPNRRTIFKFNFGKSYRVPSVYELGAYGLHRHEGRFEKGNISNNPEQAWQVDFGFDRKWKDIQLSVSPFLNYFTNYLFLAPTPYLRSEGQIYEYQQSKSIITGAEASFQWTFLQQFSYSSAIEYVYAVNLDERMALPFTPPFNVINKLSYQIKSSKNFTKNKIVAEFITTAAQNYTVPNELSTPGYNLFNLKALSQLHIGKKQFDVLLKMKNVLNTAYFNHISFYRRLRIPESGRDFQIYISMPINKL